MPENNRFINNKGVDNRDRKDEIKTNNNENFMPQLNDINFKEPVVQIKEKDFQNN